jgi:hypothetical protein
MPTYFFDLRSSTTFSKDEEGAVLSNIVAAHELALDTLGDAIRELVMEGATDVPLTIEVRDDVGRVLDVSATVRSRIIRKQ